MKISCVQNTMDGAWAILKEIEKFLVELFQYSFGSLMMRSLIYTRPKHAGGIKEQ